MLDRGGGGRSLVAPLAVLGAGVAALIAFLVLSSRSFVEVAAQAAKPSPAGTGKPKEGIDPFLPADELSTSLDRHLHRINVVALAAVCCERASDPAQTRALKREAIEMEDELRRLSAELEKRGQKPPAEERLRPEDELVQFEQTKLADIPRAEQAMLIGKFIAELKADTHVRVVVRRRSDELSFTIGVGVPSPELLRTISACTAPQSSK